MHQLSCLHAITLFCSLGHDTYKHVKTRNTKEKSKIVLKPMASYVKPTVLGNENSPRMISAITSDHGHVQVPGSVGLVPTSLPELPKPFRTPMNHKKHIFQNQKVHMNGKKQSLYPLSIHFTGP